MYKQRIIRADMIDVLFKKRPIEVLLLINKEGYTRQPDLYRRKDATFSWILKLLKLFEGEGIIIRKMEGRAKQIKLTKFGRELQDHLFEIKKIVEKKNG